MKIGERYEVLKALGSGMSGEVFLVEDPSGKKVALKYLKEWQVGVDPEEALESFKREFLILKDLNHPAIARILDFGRESSTGRYYFTAEYVEGRDFFSATEGMRPEAVEALVVEVLRALEYLHARGIYHLDLKPANLLVNSKGGIKLIDFGLAGERLRGRIAGTPSYMAPEIIFGETPDGRADLYSLGVLFYSALARTNPFRGASIAETLDRQKKIIPLPISKTSPEAPPYLDRILARLIEKNRAERYASASHVIREINLLSGRNYPVETAETLQSYLPEEGALVGRGKEWAVAREVCLRLREPGPVRLTLWVRGGKGCGKTRFLREIKYFCQLNDLKVLWITPGDPAVSLTEPSVLIIDDAEGFRDEAQERWADSIQGALGVSLLTVAASPSEVMNPLPLLQPLIVLTGAEVIALGNFSREEMKEYLVTLTGIEDPPPALVGALWERTEGNPLFVSEILKTMISGGLLFDRDGRWRLETLEDVGVDFDRMAIPKSLQALLEREYGDLSPSVRRVLIPLALLRCRVTSRRLEALVGEAVSEDLFWMIRRGLIRRDPKTDEVSLKNPLWGEIIPQILDPLEKERWHDRIADWLEGEKGFEREAALHRGDGSSAEKACQSLVPIARDLLQKGRGGEAIPVFRKILERLPRPDPRLAIDLYAGWGEAHLQADAPPEALETFRKIRPLVSEIENRDENIFYKVDIHERLASVFLKFRPPRLEEAKSDIQAGLALLEDYQDDPIRRMILENDLAQVFCQEGELTKAESLFLKTGEAWKRLSPEDRKKVTNNDLGFLYLLRKEPEKALPFLGEFLRFAEKIPRRYPEARGHYNLAEAHFALGCNEEAVGHYRRCLELARLSHAYDLLFRAYNGLGNVFGRMKRIPEGIEHYRRALGLAQKLDDRSSQAAIHTNLGILCQEVGESREGEHHLLGAIRILRALPEKSSYDLTYLARAHLELGSLLRGRRDYEKARDHLRDALRLVEENPSLQGLLFWVRYELALLYRDQGRGEEFRDELGRLREAASTDDEMKKVGEIGEITRAEREPTLPKKEASSLPEGWKGLLRILRFLGSERDLDFLLKSILRYALELSGAETALILLRDKKGGLEIRSALASGVETDLRTFSTQVAQRVLDEGRAVTTENAQVDPRFSESHSVHLLGLRSVLALPVTAPGRVVGVLYLDTRISSGELNRVETLELLQAFADQAGLALENARLLQEAEEARRGLQGRLDQTDAELSLARSLLKEESVRFQTRYSYKNIVTRSPRMHELFRLLDRITDTPLAVLIQGETGTGKELIARALHYNSSRRDREFVAVNCGAIPSELMESELFGHKVGAFTGATRDKVGLCEAADGGTLFLDEVGELSAALQVKLLRFIQEKEFRRVGETEMRRADVRVISATHQDLQARIREGRFREDLYFRLCEIAVLLPPLRERKEDIPLLVERFTEDYRQEMKFSKKFRMEKGLLRRMVDYPWPGNVRELENLVRVACALAEDQLVTADSLPSHSPLAGRRGEKADTSPGSAVPVDGSNLYRPDWSWSAYERCFVAHAYRHHRFKAIPTAKAIGVTPPTVYRRIREWNLEDPENPVYRGEFQYPVGTDLKGFRAKVFQAALTHHGRPYAALRALGVSQGFFYKIIRGGPPSLLLPPK